MTQKQKINIKRERINYFLRDKVVQSVKEPEFDSQNTHLKKLGMAADTSDPRVGENP